MATIIDHKEPLFARLPENCLNLAQRMSDISEHSWCAGWAMGVEYNLWFALQKGAGEHEGIYLSDEDVSALHKLSELCGCWIVFVDGYGLVAVPLDDWRGHCVNRVEYPLRIHEYLTTPGNTKKPELAGIILADEFDNSIKRKLLIVDRLVVVGFPEDFDNRPGVQVAYIDGDKSFLHSDGIRPYRSLTYPWLSDEEFTLSYEISRQGTKQSKEEGDILALLKPGQTTQAHRASLKRLASTQLRRIFGYDSVPCLDKFEHFSRYTSERKAVVLNLVFESLNLFDDTVSYEAIRNFKNDSDNRNRLLGLRDWMSEISSGEYAPSELTQKIEWLINEHNKSLKIHEIKHRRGIFETVVVTTAEIAEDLLKLKLSKLAKAAFKIRRSDASLLEAEIQSPGAQLAYIVHARQQFGGKSFQP